MSKIVLAFLYADKKFNKRVNYYDANELVKIGALDSVPVCPENGVYCLDIENGRRQIRCSVHGVLRISVPSQTVSKRNADIMLLGRITAKSGLNLRKEPSTKSQKVSSVAFCNDVILLEKSIKDTIENITDNWYKVTDGEITGWAFGGFLDITQGFILIDKDNGFQLKMITCPAGSFMMGSPMNELGRSDDELQHKVTISKSFFIGKFEVTQRQYKAIMGVNPSEIKDDNLPATNISWNDAKDFCDKLNAYYKDIINYVYRDSEFFKSGLKFDLPTEAQWEYACRAGTTTSLNSGKNITYEEEYCTKLDEVGFYLNNSSDRPHYVGQKKPNAWGIYDMHGNVVEWCRDYYGDYPSSSVTDPFVHNNGSFPIYRGGGWGDYGRNCRSASRLSNFPTLRLSYVGFRLALVPDD